MSTHSNGNDGQKSPPLLWIVLFLLSCVISGFVKEEFVVEVNNILGVVEGDGFISLVMSFFSRLFITLLITLPCLLWLIFFNRSKRS